MIISVSRRCDIPRFRFGWFLERLDAGFVDVANPFNPRQVKRVPLLPPSPERLPDSSAELFVFWTRDPASILEHADALEGRGYPFYVMVSLTGYPALLEPAVPPAGDVIRTLTMLAGKITPERVVWRYDPVFLSDITDYAFHRSNFAGLAASLKGAVKKVIVSVYDEYPGAERRLAALEKNGSLKRLAHYAGPEAKGPGALPRPLLPETRGLLASLAETARKEGMKIRSCAEENLADCGIEPGACIDGTYAARAAGIPAPGKDPGQKRPGCLCVKSTDIGSYGPCPAGCVYCYGIRR